MKYTPSVLTLLLLLTLLACNDITPDIATDEAAILRTLNEETAAAFSRDLAG